MKIKKNEQVDAATKKAWERNWENISIDEIMEIFKYARVKKQMEIFTRVLPKEGKILEGGCGLAPYLIRLRRLGYDIEGIDYNAEPVRKVKEWDSSLPVSVGDVTDIRYPDGTFSGYLSLGVIEHFTEGPQKAIAEANRVLKSGGLFFVSVPTRNWLMDLSFPLKWVKGLGFLRRLFNKPEDTHYWEQYFRKKDLVRYLEEGGFEIREIIPLDHSHVWASFHPFFRDQKTYDEASPLALRLGAWCEKHVPWQMCAQMTLICYKAMDLNATQSQYPRS